MIFSHGVKLAGTASLLALSALGAAAPALAQDAADAVSAQTGLNDIVVTAPKRVQRLQDVPVYLVAIGVRPSEDMQITYLLSLCSQERHVGHSAYATCKSRRPLYK